MTLEDALRVIGRELIGRACADALMQAHPDGGGADSTAVERISEIKAARAVINHVFDSLAEPPRNPCTACRGVGSIAGRFGATICKTCNGTGEKS